ncbi:MAG: M56 family metallopeptidase, partial [Peptococcaceae bacterium]|nr:M56 family metallopeptidase [Peptococcaceae bacterium]
MNVIQMSLSAALIIVVAVIVRALAMYKLPKKTFLALWGVALCRLLIPFSIPAKTSVFGLIAYIRAQIAGSSAASVSHILPESAVAPAAVIPPVTVVEPAMTVVSPDAVLSWGSPLLLVWLAGTALLGLYFAYLYLKCRREFAASLPAQHAFIPPWQESHPLKRAYSIRVSDRITVPLTYGVFRPVILLPKGLEASDEKQLSYILSHELVHIRRFDALTKLVATAALCVHWFNPLVWVMYILLNRDLEISCDEKVVREWDEAPKSEYALMLVSMAAKKGALSPLYSGFSKYAIEERINAIMKNKQISMIGVVLAVLLVAGTVSVLATSAAGNAQGGANGGAEKVDTAIAWSRSPGGEITEAPYHAPAGMNTWDYLYSLGFLEYDDTTYFQPLYRFNGQWVEAIYDPNIWRGYDYSNFAQANDVNKRFGEAVGVKVVRDAQTNEITGLVEMTDAEINAARAEGGDKTSGQLTEIPFVTDSAESPIPPIDWETVDPKIKAVIYPDSGDMRKMRLLSVSAEDEPRFSPEDWQIVLLAVEQGLVAWEDGSVLLARINYQKHHDLTQDGALVMTADALVRYQLFTNSTQIAVFLAQDPAEPVTFDLYDSQYAEP